MLVWQAHKSRIRHMAFSPDGAELATTAGSSKYVWRWRAATGEPLPWLAGHTTYARAVGYSPDGRFVASTQNGPDAHVWDRERARLVATLAGSNWGRESVSFRPDSSAVAVATGAGACEWPVSQFDGSGRRRLKAARAFGAGSWFHRVLFSPCGRYLATSQYRQCCLFDAAGGKLLHTFVDLHGCADPTLLAFAPDGNSLATVFGLRVHLFAVPDGDERAVLRGHPNYIHALGFMPDGRAVVSAGADGVVRTWGAATGAPGRSFDWGIGKVCAAAVSPDGTLCAAGGENGKVVVWDVDS